MKALSIKQPWLNLILGGEKTIEVRQKNTTYRGEVLLCASQSPALTTEAMEEMEELIGMPYLFGHALCVARLVDSRPMQPGDEDAAFQEEIDPQMYGWVLDRVRPVNPFEVKGAVGFFEVDDALINVSPYALWDNVCVRDEVDEQEVGFPVAGWQGRILSVVFADEEGWLLGFSPDSISVKDLPLEHIESAIQEGETWHLIWLDPKEVEPVAPRDTLDEATMALEAIEQAHPDLFPEEDDDD